MPPKKSPVNDVEQSQPPRQRRPRGEPRRLLIASAQEVFNRKGYTSSSTREIAEHAQVSETLMFRYFGSKAGLFREAMVKPFVDVVDAWITRRLADPMRFEHPREETRQFIAVVYDMFRTHRALAASLFAADALTESELAESGVFDEVRFQIERLVLFGIQEAEEQGATVSAAEHPLSTRAVLAMVAGMSTFGTWYYGNRRPSRNAIIDEITDWVVNRYLPTETSPWARNSNLVAENQPSKNSKASTTKSKARPLEK